MPARYLPPRTLGFSYQRLKAPSYSPLGQYARPLTQSRNFLCHTTIHRSCQATPLDRIRSSEATSSWLRSTATTSERCYKPSRRGRWWIEQIRGASPLTPAPGCFRGCERWARQLEQGSRSHSLSLLATSMEASLPRSSGERVWIAAASFSRGLS